MLTSVRFFACALLLVALTATTKAQHDHDEAPASISVRTQNPDRTSDHSEGLRSNPPRTTALINGLVHRSPTSSPEAATVIINGSKIVAIGNDLEIPAGTRVIDLAGKHLYSGFIDGYVGKSVELNASTGTHYWNDNVRAELEVSEAFDLAGFNAKQHREAGFTAALVAPTSGVINGQSSLLLLSDADHKHAYLAKNLAQHLRLTVGRGGGRQSYPTSPMGAYALARQALYDAQWYQQAWQIARGNPDAERPELNDSLDALQSVLDGSQMAMVETSNESFALRADRFAREFGLQLVILGSGNEYRRLDEVVATGRTIVLPINFPAPPDVSSPESAADVSLETMMHWDHAPENPARLEKRGVNFVFTTKGLKDPKELLKKLRQAVERGLSPQAALAALTTRPAQLYHVDHLVGTLEPNKLANIAVADGDLFAEKTKIVQTWVDGLQYQFDHDDSDVQALAGNWKVTNAALKGKYFVLKVNGEKITGQLMTKEQLDKVNQEKNQAKSKSKEESADKADNEDSNSKSEDKEPTKKEEQPIGLKSLRFSGSQLTGTFVQPANEDHDAAAFLFTLTVSKPGEAIGQLVSPDGSVSDLTAKLQAADVDKSGPDQSSKKSEDAALDDSKQKSDDADDHADHHAHGDHEHGKDEDSQQTDDQSKTAQETAKRSVAATYPVNYPLGSFGRSGAPEQPKSVLIKHVTVWTLDSRGKLDDAAVLFGDGKILEVFESGADLPAAEIVVDGTGQHVTPGLIDCHSHMATDSGINEVGQAITAEVRIGDMIDCDDVNIYRQLAGGITSSNILHGSANPIGGQNQVIKLRWGANEEQLKFAGAPAGIKFALGENVKQSNWSTPSNRYPQTRMGVEQIMDDTLQAALDYQQRWQDWQKQKTGLPPRRDLELDAIAEILDGTRWIHCHSYRQDEILALLNTLEKYKITIGSYQHILEGYKVADRMAKQGAMASAFSDWWAYKYEVKDAIPFAGALMYRAGVVVSFNSDDAELGRHMNQEAAKAVRYGGVPEVEALKFVTLNPARQLRIDDRVGSIEPGKDADLVLWSGHPLSNLSTVKQAWIDGRKYFDRSEDLKTRSAMVAQRAALIQKILVSGEPMKKLDKDSIDPAKLWPRYDAYCHGHSHGDGHDHDGDHVHE